MNLTVHTRLGDDRRVAIPAKLCHKLGWSVGEPLTFEEQGEALRIVPVSQILREIQESFAPYRTEGESLVDELIAEREAEAARENLHD
jgi:bifunctional DNA-binding transcriptional regulator/antitoxin component of YhaV-PrlF toxin-antitoxin module